MKSSQNPFGLHTITPYLMVSDVQKLIDFLKTVFDATIRGDISYRDDQSVQHAEIQIGDSFIMMGEPMKDIKTNTVGLYTYVADCDAVYKKALEQGGTSVLEPADYPHGDRYGGVMDFAGNTWWIVSHIGKKH